MPLPNLQIPKAGFYRVRNTETGREAIGERYDTPGIPGTLAAGCWWLKIDGKIVENDGRWQWEFLEAVTTAHCACCKELIDRDSDDTRWAHKDPWCLGCWEQATSDSGGMSPDGEVDWA